MSGSGMDTGLGLYLRAGLPKLGGIVSVSAPTTSISPVDLTVLIVYLAATTLLGLWVGRKNTSAEQFTSAGGRLPGWAVGLSIFGTFVSSISFLALPGKAYGSDWNALVFSLSIPLAAWVAVRWFVPFYRKSGQVSAYQHLEERFGPWARTYAVVCYLLTQLGRMGTITYMLAIALQPLTGWSLTTIIWTAGYVVLLYSFVGGIEAVIWTDVVQSVVLIGGALLCLALLVSGLPGGTTQLFSAEMAPKFSLGSFQWDWQTATFWTVLVYGLVINLQNFGIDQSYVQRYATAKSDAEASKSVWLGALLYVPISAVFLLIGTALYAYYQSGVADLPIGIKNDEVFPHFIKHGLPVGVSGLLVAGIFAAAQSTLSSSVNCAATLIHGDLYQRYLRPQASPRESLRVLRLATLVFSLGGTMVAFKMIGTESALDAWWKVAGVFSGGMLGLFLLGLLSRASNAVALLSVLLGVAVISWMTLSSLRPDAVPEGMRSHFHDYWVPVFGTLTILLAGFILTVLAGRKKLKS
ncbi:MAG: sodium:solute symporter [Verrucomicrobiales bacterium]|nr:sodium:solute symporter [Verrucomicrobiales bacterium]